MGKKKKKANHVGMTFPQFLKERRDHICQDLTNWADFRDRLNGMLPPEVDAISSSVLDRIVAMNDPIQPRKAGDKPRPKTATMNRVARALGFDTWYDAAQAWEAGRDPRDIPTAGRPIIELGKPPQDDAD